MLATALLLVMLCSLVFLAAMGVCIQLRQVQAQQAVDRTCRGALEGKFTKLVDRVAAMERRLDLLGAPQTEADLIVLRRLLEEIADRLQRLVDENDEEQWWKRGDNPPY